MNRKIRNRLLSGAIILVILLCAPFSQIDLASGIGYTLPDAAPEPEKESAVTDGKYNLTLNSSIGTLTYYNQSDSRWADYLYGGEDPLHKYGCGPTVLAMLVTSFTGKTVLPSDMADWAVKNHYWAPHSGTEHSFIPEGAKAFGFKAKSFKNLTKDGIISELTSGHILVALMGPGHFTSSGHFIIITDYWSGNKVCIADPVDLDNTQKAWKIQLILDELSSSSNYGGPVWSISPE